MKGYTVRYERDESGWWVAQVREVPEALTQGRTLAETRRRIREALAVVLDDDRAAEEAPLIDEVKLPSGVRRALTRARAARRRLEADAVQAQETTEFAVRELTRSLGLSVRDAGELLGISHQRVQQLARAGR
jgi:predicted RNase H-like HicB family nuclease